MRATDRTTGWRVWAGAVVMLAGMSPHAGADDVVPPEWRGDGLYTFQEWEFMTPGAIPPDGEIPTFNPNGVPLMTPGSGVAWDPNFQTFGLDGYVGNAGGGSLLFAVPNYIDLEPEKFIRVQINGVWGVTPPSVASIAAVDNVEPNPVIQFLASDERFPGFHRWEDWLILPNPDSETIQIDVPSGAFVNQVIIETTSIPEPSGFVLLLGAGLMLARGTYTRHRT